MGGPRRRALGRVVGALVVAMAASAAPAQAAPMCLGKRATIVVTGASASGTAHADVIVIAARGGASVRAGAGDDRICGGPGPDHLYGGPGDDVLRARGRGDQLRGGAGKDTFFTRGGHAQTDAEFGERVDGKLKLLAAQTKASTVTVSPNGVRRVTGSPGGRQVISLSHHRRSRRLRPGAAVIIAPSRQAPQGVLGVVTSITATRHGIVATTRPATIDEAYARFELHVDETLSELGAHARVASVRAEPRAVSPFALAGTMFDCQGSAKLNPPKLSMDYSKLRFQLEFLPLGPSIHFLLAGTPQVSLDASWDGNASCEYKGTLKITVPLPAGLVLTLRPAFTISASGDLSAHVRWGPRIAVGFDRGAGVSQNLKGFGLGAPDVSASGKAGGTAFLGAALELSLAGRAGVQGEIGPEVTATPKGTPLTPCLAVDGALKVRLTAEADAFVKHWSFSLFSGSFFPQQLQRCDVQGPVAPVAGGGGAPIASGGFQMPAGGGPAFSIAAGRDGYMWYTRHRGIGRIAPGGAISEFPLANNAGSHYPYDVALGPDGNMWFTEVDRSHIGRITPAGQITEFALPGAPSGGMFHIAAGPDGNMWFGDVGSVGRIAMNGSITEFSLGSPGASHGMVLGADRNLWFTTFEGIGRITPAGDITEFSIAGLDLAPSDIAASPDGYLWINDNYYGPSAQSSARIGRVTMAGVNTEFVLPTTAYLADLAPGPGGIWYASGPLVGRITSSGTVTERPLDAGSIASGIAAGPDGYMWVVDQASSTIRRVAP